MTDPLQYCWTVMKSVSCHAYEKKVQRTFFEYGGGLTQRYKTKLYV